jgi:hypothetical protein
MLGYVIIRNIRVTVNLKLQDSLKFLNTGTFLVLDVILFAEKAFTHAQGKSSSCPAGNVYMGIFHLA